MERMITSLNIISDPIVKSQGIGDNRQNVEINMQDV